MDYVTVRIGKSGVTPELVKEMNDVLRKRKKLRVKILKSGLTRDRRDIMDEVKKKTRCRKATIRGNTFILEK